MRCRANIRANDDFAAAGVARDDPDRVGGLSSSHQRSQASNIVTTCRTVSGRFILSRRAASSQ